ncbi:MAG: DUF58 domain-containing protein [Planctomycetota bacterium]
MAIIPIVAVLLILGMLTGTSLFSLGASTFLIVIEISRFLSKRWAEAVAVERHQQLSEIPVGESLTIGLQIKNQSNYWIPWMILEDRLPRVAIHAPPQALEIVGKTVRLQSLASRQNRLFTYTLRSKRRGYFQIGPTILETGDLLGLHRSYRVVNQPQYISVLPRIVAMEGLEIASRRPMGEMRVEDRGMEDPTLMAGIRQYQAGDPINRVHWKATARTGVLHTRIFQPTCLQGAMLLVDLHEASNPQHHEPVRSDLAVTAAASIAHLLYTLGQPFGLVSNGRDAADRVRAAVAQTTYTDHQEAVKNIDMRAKSERLRPVVMQANRGPEHFADLHRLLARLERTDGLPLPQLVSETESRLPRMLSVLSIVQQVDDEGALALAMLRRRGFAVTVIVNQPAEEYRESAARLARHHLATSPLPNEEALAAFSKLWLADRIAR